MPDRLALNSPAAGGVDKHTRVQIDRFRIIQRANVLDELEACELLRGIPAIVPTRAMVSGKVLEGTNRRSSKWRFGDSLHVVHQPDARSRRFAPSRPIRRRQTQLVPR